MPSKKGRGLKFEEALLFALRRLFSFAWLVIRFVARSVQGKQKMGKESKASKVPQYEPLLVSSVVEGSYDVLEEGLLNRSLIVLVFGKRGSGKSALGFRLLENICAHRKRRGFVLGVEQRLLPKWISSVESIVDVKEGSAILVDEGAVLFSSRESMRKANIELGKLLAVARHSDVTVLLITQNTGMIDRNALNLADVLFVKEGSLLQSHMERTVVKQLVSKADVAIKQQPPEARTQYVYVFSDDFEGLCKASLPSFWSQRLSKSHVVR